MNKLFLFALLIPLVSPAFADDLRIARFDAKRVFENYQHTKEAELKVSTWRLPMGPGSVNATSDAVMTAREKVFEVANKTMHASAGTPEREKLEVEKRIAELELEVAELRSGMHGLAQLTEHTDETLRDRAAIIKEIWAEAKLLATEHHYSLLVADGLEAEVSNVFVPAASKLEDVTEELLQRINNKYSAGHSAPSK
jgi:hypothetical protein